MLADVLVGSGLRRCVACCPIHTSVAKTHDTSIRKNGFSFRLILKGTTSQLLRILKGSNRLQVFEDTAQDASSATHETRKCAQGELSPCWKSLMTGTNHYRTTSEHKNSLLLTNLRLLSIFYTNMSRPRDQGTAPSRRSSL